MAAQPSSFQALGNTMSKSQPPADDFETFKASLSAEILILFIGSKRRRTVVHWTMLQTVAPIVRDMSFFKTHFEDATIDEPTKVAYLPKDDPEAFELFCFWLYRRSLPDLEDPGLLPYVRKARVVAHFKLYRLATKFEVLALQSATGGRLELLLDSCIFARLETLGSDEILDFLRDADPRCHLRNYILKWICYNILPFRPRYGQTMNADWMSTFLKSYPTVSIAILQTFNSSLCGISGGLIESFRMDAPVFSSPVLFKTNNTLFDAGSVQTGGEVSESSQPSGGLFGAKWTRVAGEKAAAPTPSLFGLTPSAQPIPPAPVFSGFGSLKNVGSFGYSDSFPSAPGTFSSTNASTNIFGSTPGTVSGTNTSTNIFGSISGTASSANAASSLFGSMPGTASDTNPFSTLFGATGDTSSDLNSSTSSSERPLPATYAPPSVEDCPPD